MTATAERTLVALVVALCIGCSGGERHHDIPPPVAIAIWAERVDTLAGTYSGVGGLAEFWDTVVVAPDVRERIVWRVNLTNDVRTKLGSSGDGPGEYRYAGIAMKVHPDSVALLQSS